MVLHQAAKDGCHCKAWRRLSALSAVHSSKRDRTDVVLCMHDQGCVATHPVTGRRAPLLADKPVHLPGPVGCAQQVQL